MRILLPMQLKYIGIPILAYSFFFMLYVFFSGANADPFLFSMISMIILGGSTFSFLKDANFHRILFSMPITTKEVIKSIYVASFIAFLYLFIVSMLLTYYLTVSYGESMQLTMIFFNTILVFLGMHIRYNLTTDMEMHWGLEFLIFFGVFFLYGIPSMLFSHLFVGSENIFEDILPYNFLIKWFIVFVISLVIYWRMYKKSANTITAFYIEIEEKLKNEHRSIHEND